MFDFHSVYYALKDIYYYDRQGKPIDILTWSEYFEDDKYKIIKQEHTPKGRFWVSTVWLGIDHRFDFHGNKRLIFETMVFKRNSTDEVACLRGSTEKEALEDHKQLLREWTEKEK